MMPTVAALSFDGKGEPSAYYAQEVELWPRAKNLGVTRRATAIVLHMEPAVRDARTTVVGDRLLGQDAGPKVMRMLRDNFAPRAPDSVYREVVSPIHF